MTLAATIRARRKALGFSLNETSLRVRMSLTHLADIEHGRRGVSLARAWQLAGALNADAVEWVEMALNEELKDAGLKLRVKVERS